LDSLDRWVAVLGKYGADMEPRRRTFWGVIGIAAAFGALLNASAVLSQDWVPVFPSDKAALRASHASGHLNKAGDF
jgi:hypothetical protein